MPETDASDRSALTQRVRLALRRVGPSLGRLNDLVGSSVDLKGVDLGVLDHIGRVGPISPGDLADAMHIHPATMTGILDRLEGGGWVVRERASDDRRRVQLKVLRTRGRELVRLYAPMNTALDEICAGMSVSELRTVVEFLSAVSSAAVKAAEQVAGERQLG